MRSPSTSVYLSTGLAQYEIQGRHPNSLSWNESQIQRLLLKTLPGSTVILRILTYTQSIPSYPFPHMSSGNWHGYSNINVLHTPPDETPQARHLNYLILIHAY